MAYVAGVANSINDLRVALINACTANGWTLNTDILSKGGVYVRVRDNGSDLLILGGTGKDGSDNLTGSGPFTVRIASFGTPAQLTYPMNYEIHINTSPDEVYCVVNYSGVYYQYCAFGKSTITLPGTGNWYSASQGQSNSDNGGSILISPTDGGGVSFIGYPSAALFWTTDGSGQCQNNFIHHGIDGNTWSSNANYNSVGGVAQAIKGIAPLMSIAPNAWNGECPLMVISPVIARASSFYSMVAQIAHARYIRVDNFDPGQTITLGTDKWRVYPWLSKNTTARNGGNVKHSGTMGWAVRYTGP